MMGDILVDKRNPGDEAERGKQAEGSQHRKRSEPAALAAVLFVPLPVATRSIDLIHILLIVSALSVSTMPCNVDKVLTDRSALCASLRPITQTDFKQRDVDWLALPSAPSGQ